MASYKRGEVGELPVPGTHNRGPHFKSTGNADDRWYDWRLRYWDTKWDCYDLEIDEDDLPHGFEVSSILHGLHLKESVEL